MPSERGTTARTLSIQKSISTEKKNHGPGSLTYRRGQIREPKGVLLLPMEKKKKEISTPCKRRKEGPHYLRLEEERKEISLRERPVPP